MMKRITAFCLCICLGAVLFGCDEKETQEKKEKILWCGEPSKMVEENSETEKYLEKKYNIEIEIANVKNDETLSAMIALGNIPDVMFLREPQVWQPFARQNILAPITIEQIKLNAPNHYAQINKHGENLWISGMDNGKLWVVPQLIGEELTHVGIIRKDWLEKVGISKMPKTLDEYEEVFYRFTYGDPDGDGKNNTYGLTGMGGHQYRQFDSIFGAFGVIPGQWSDNNGVVSLDTVSDGALEALKLLNKWYQSGYIHPECVSDTVESSNYKFKTGIIGVTFDTHDLFVESQVNGKENLAKLRQSCPEAEVCFSYPPQGADGSFGSFKWGPRANFVGFGKQLAEQPEKLNKILNILDELCYDEETAIRQYWGVEGVHYKNSTQTDGGFAFTDEFSQKKQRKEAGIGGFFSLFVKTQWASAEIVEKYLPADVTEITKELISSSNIGYDCLMRNFLPSSVNLQQKLDNYKSISYSKFITGERSFDEWPLFVNEFMNMGGAQLTKEAQEMYDKYFK